MTRWLVWLALALFALLVLATSPGEFRQRVQSESTRLGKLIRDKNVKVE